MHCTIYREGETLDLPSRRVREVTARKGRYGLYGGLRPARGVTARMGELWRVILPKCVSRVYMHKR